MAISHNIGLPPLDFATICPLLYSIKSTFHAPSLIAREIKSEMESFLSSTFLMSTTGFKGEGEMGLMEQFLCDPAKTDNLLKGPWLAIKLPFRTASSA